MKFCFQITDTLANFIASYPGLPMFFNICTRKFYCIEKRESLGRSSRLEI